MVGQEKSQYRAYAVVGVVLALKEQVIPGIGTHFICTLAPVVGVVQRQQLLVHGDVKVNTSCLEGVNYLPGDLVAVGGVEILFETVIGVVYTVHLCDEKGYYDKTGCKAPRNDADRLLAEFIAPPQQLVR